MQQEDRLEGWKEIADYVRRSPKTARRWERLGMPVRRMEGAKGTIVFAYRSEIDAWREARERSDSPARLAAPPGRRAAGIVALLAVGLAAGIIIGFGLAHRTLQGPAVTIADGFATAPPAELIGARARADVLEELTAAAASTRAATGLIAFHTVSNDNAEIYLMDDDGADLRRLTHHPADDLHPAISPDGTRIAFSSDRDGFPAIYVLEINGGHLERVTPEVHSPEGFASGVHWHPDGTKLVTSIRLDADGTAQLFEIHPRTGEFLQLTHTPTNNLWPRYSYDGTRIYVSSSAQGDGRSSEIVVYGPDGRRKLTESLDNGTPDEVLLPDGRARVFYQKVVTKGIQQIYRLSLLPRADSQPATVIEEPVLRAADFVAGRPLGPRGPGASRRAGDLLFHSDLASPGTSNLWRMRVDGSGLEKLTEVNVYAADWWVAAEDDERFGSGASGTEGR